MRNSDDITRAMQAHADTVLRVCSVYFHGHPDRDDAFQETFIRYAQSEKEFHDEEHVKAWLIRVATNVCKDMVKSAHAKTVLTDDIEDTAQPTWNDPQAESSSDAADRLNAALQRIDENYRIALYLKYYEGYTAAEIAKVLDMPENTVYTNLARGRQKLKEVLEHDDE